MNFTLPPRKPWWRRKRLLLPAATLFMVIAVVALALMQSPVSTVVIYNETGETIPRVRMEACGQVRTFISLPDQSSVRTHLGPAGDASSIVLEFQSEPVWRWEGAYVEPRGGYRVMIRIYADHQVEAHSQISLWHRLSGRWPLLHL